MCVFVCVRAWERERERLPKGEREFMQQKNDMESGVCLPFYTHSQNQRESRTQRVSQPAV